MSDIELTIPRYSGNFTVVYKDDKSNFLYEGEVPKELMDAYQELIGDGKARVAVSAGVGIKDFGTGADASVTVSLTCNQDQQTINKAIGLAAQTAQQAAAYYQSQGAAQAKQLETQQRAGQPGRPHY